MCSAWLDEGKVLDTRAVGSCTLSMGVDWGGNDMTGVFIQDFPNKGHIYGMYAITAIRNIRLL